MTSRGFVIGVAALVVAVFGSWAVPALATGGNQPAWFDDVDRLLTTEFKADRPGASVVVARHGKVLLRKSYGLASVDPAVPLTVDMPLPLASVTKQFTAVAILLLAERGKVRLDEPAQRFFPELPKSVTVEHLLTHTSGVKSFTDMQAWFEKVRIDPTKAVPRGEVLAMVLKEPLVFEPGTAEGYSNSNYMLLGEIVERLSGRAYESFLAENILRPLAMTKTVCGSAERIRPVVGYRKGEGGYEPQPYFGGPGCSGGGGLVSTVDDLAKWGAALSGDKMLSKRSRKAMRQAFLLKDGTEASWGYGTEVWDYGGHAFRLHGGYIWGFPSMVILSPADGTFVALLSNNASSEIDSQYLARQVAALAVGRRAVEPKAIDLPSEASARYVGVYQGANGRDWKVRRQDGQLFTQRAGGQRWPMYPESTNRFFYKKSFARVTFAVDADGRVTQAVLSGEGRPETLQRIGDVKERVAIELAPELLESYVGEYEIRAGSVAAITRDGVRLFAQPTGGAREEIFAHAEGSFFLKSSDQLFTFVKGTDGRVAAVVLSDGDWSIEAKRVR